MKIAGIPKQFKDFLDGYRDLFSKTQFSYFRIYVYSLLLLPKEKKNVNQMASSWVRPVCRSSLQKLLSEAKFEWRKVLKRSATRAIRLLSHRKKKDRVAELILDDTTLKKYGDQVFGVGWFKKNERELAWLGLQLVVVGLLIDDWLIPLDFRIYIPESRADYYQVTFQTKLELARDLLREVKIPREYRVDVMFDSWYLNEKVTKAIELHHNWFWYARIRSNRKIQFEGETKSESKQLRFYAQGIQWQPLAYKSTRKRPALVGHQRLGKLGKIGQVKLVISSLVADGSEKVAYFCTNRRQIPLIGLLQKYERRWKIEVFFRESRGHLGLEKWYFQSEASVVRHLCLSLVAAVACICLRIAQLKPGESLGSIGEFIEELRRQNQRALLRCFLQQPHLDFNQTIDENKFNDLCLNMGF